MTVEPKTKAPRLVLYSDQIARLTDAIDDRLFSMLPSSGTTIGYIPSSPDPDRVWFESQERYYSRLGAQLIYFGLEEEFEPSRIPELLSCDAIHLTGGNTYQFLYWLRLRGMDSVLKEFVAKGGVLIGVSAGAILMTPDTSTSSLCGDEPYPGLEDLSGLGLVDFAVVPHFDGSPKAESDLQGYVSTFRGTVYAIPDGGGIVVEGESVELFDLGQGTLCVCTGP